MTRRLPSSSRPGPGGTTLPSKGNATGQSSGWLQRHRWVGRLCLAALGPLVLLVLVEFTLRLAGYGYPASFFVRSEDGDSYLTNQKFTWQFFGQDTALKPFLFKLPKAKDPGSFRICILGESAAMGTPDPAFSFGRILEAGFRRNFPHQKFEIVNAAVRGINSHVIRSIARECARHDIDVFVIYMGNNEMVGLHSPGPETPAWAGSLALIRLSDWARATKLGQLLGAVGNRVLGKRGVPVRDMAYFRRQALRVDDPRRAEVYAHFRANLDEICRATTGSGAKTILCTVPVNLRDFPPLQSLLSRSRSDAELRSWQEDYDKACELQKAGEFGPAQERLLRLSSGDSYAELFFRLGQCYLRVGQYAQARTCFEKARDSDALQFRTDFQLNQIIRDVASFNASRGVALLDSERLLAENDPDEAGIPGARMFQDHVHPTFAGNYGIARLVYDRLIQTSERLREIGKDARFPLQEECARAIAYTEYDDLEVTAAFNQLSAKPPFLDQLDHDRRQAQVETEYARRAAAFSREKAETCLKIYQAAIQEDPEFWPLRFNVAALYEAIGQPSAAAEQYRWIVNQFPQVKRFRISLANALTAAGDKPGALSQLRAALRLDPRDGVLREQLKKLE